MGKDSQPPLGEVMKSVVSASTCVAIQLTFFYTKSRYAVLVAFCCHTCFVSESIPAPGGPEILC